MAAKFDQNAYWVERHEKFRGDLRSVGNLGKTVAENARGERRLVSAAKWAANDLKPLKTVLDIGCGYGRLASCFCDAGFEYTGVDVAPEAIEAARKREPRGKFILGSALQVEFEKRFDLVCACYVFVHFVDEDDWLSLVNRICGQIAKSGALLLADDFPNVEQCPAKHVRLRPLTRYLSALREHQLVRDLGFKERLLESFSSKGSPPPFELFRMK